MKTFRLLLIAAAWTAAAFAQPSFQPGAVVNASGYQTVLAPNTVFVIFGSNLGPGALATGAAPDYPEELAGTSVTFTPLAGGAAINARMVYTSSGQLAGLLPSAAAPGDYAVRVLFNGQTSPPQTVTVAARSFGIVTANSQGFGPAQATIGNVNGGVSLVRFTSGEVAFGGLNYVLTPAKPGQTIVLWGTGGGADAANDAGGSSGDQTAAGNFRVLLRDTVIVPDYAGTSFGLPGLWQVNFTIPQDFEPYCFNRLQVSADGVLSNNATLAVAPEGENHCISTAYDEAALAKLDNGGELTGASLLAASSDYNFASVNPAGVTTGTSRTITGLFLRYDAAAIIELESGLEIGACTIHRRMGPQPRIGVGIPKANLDAGPSLAITGPGLPANSTLAKGDPTNYYLAPAELNPGTYTISGPGGPDIGPFEASVDVPANFNVPDFPTFARIDRTVPFTFNWTGGGGDDGTVTVNILTTRTISGSINDPETWIIARTTVFCEVPASLGTFTVSPEVLSYLTPASLDPATGTDANLAINASMKTSAGTFRPPLTAGGIVDFGGYLYSLGYTKNLAVD
jgi:trimeric autotransporter adhesin